MRKAAVILAVILSLSGFNNKLYAQNIPILDINRDSILNAYEREVREISFYKKKLINVNDEDIIKIMDALPAFAIYRDTYFSTGIPLNRSINCNTADALFQISIRHRVTRSVLPFNTFLFFTYSQKSFWDVYAESCPFRDNNYNPGLGLGRYITKDNKMLGAGFIQIEHESNGRDGDESRSWNYLSASAKYFHNPRLSLAVKAWIPFVDGGNNKDLIDYRGIATFAVNYMSRNLKWWASAEVTPRKGWGNANTVLSLAFIGSKKSNTYFYLRFSDGIGESLLDYNKYSMNLRAGICFKPDFYSIF